MPLGREVGLSPSDIVLGGDPAPPPQKDAEPPIFGPSLLWPNGWMDQDETWHGCRPRPWPHCVGWGPAPLPKRGVEPPIFGPCLLWPHGCMGQDATWKGGRPQPKRHCVTQLPSPKRARSAPIFGPCLLWPNGWAERPDFWPMSIVAKRLDGSRWHLLVVWK